MSDWHNRSHCNRTHVDEGVLRYFYGVLGCRSLLDIGCGPGGQLEKALEVGYAMVQGLDGDPAVRSAYVSTHDFLDSAAPSVFFGGSGFDLAWCNEFLEHIPEDKLDNVWPCFDACKYAAITAHPPTGKKIEFHYNEQDCEYWIAKFKARGWAYDSYETEQAREASTMQRDFFRDYGLVFFNPNWKGK